MQRVAGSELFRSVAGGEEGENRSFFKIFKWYS